MLQLYNVKADLMATWSDNKSVITTQVACSIHIQFTSISKLRLKQLFRSSKLIHRVCTAARKRILGNREDTETNTCFYS